MKYTRRDFLRLAGAGGAGWLLGWRHRRGAGAGTARELHARPASTDSIRILALSRALDSTLLSAFTDSTGVAVERDLPPSGVADGDQISGYDLAAVPARALTALIQRGLVRELEPMPLPPLGQRAYDPLNSFSLPAAHGAIGINSRGVEPPASWAELFALARTVPAYLPPAESFSAALKALGHSINTRDTYAREQARALVATVLSVPLDRSSLAVGHPLSDWTFSVPTEGAEFWEDCYCIPADSLHPEWAHTFIQFAVTAQPLAPLPQVPLEPHSPFGLG